MIQNPVLCFLDMASVSSHSIYKFHHHIILRLSSSFLSVRKVFISTLNPPTHFIFYVIIFQYSSSIIFFMEQLLIIVIIIIIIIIMIRRYLFEYKDQQGFGIYSHNLYWVNIIATKHLAWHYISICHPSIEGFLCSSLSQSIPDMQANLQVASWKAFKWYTKFRW